MFDDFNDDDDFFAYEETPIYQKALEIWELAHRIAEIASDSNTPFKMGRKQHVLKEFSDYIIEDASILAPKVAGAWGTQYYDAKMENATIIRKSAQDLLLHLRALEMYGFKDVEYCELLRNEIEEFRILFAQWVQTFDPWDYVIDRWGLFNPPGIAYDDVDEQEFSSEDFEWFEDFLDDYDPFEDDEDEVDDEVDDEDEDEDDDDFESLN